MKIDYIIPTLYRPTLSRTIASIQSEGREHNLFICGTQKSAGENRNECLKQVKTSDWVVFVDDDDYLKNGHKKVLSESQDCDVVILRMKQGENIIPRYENRVIESGNVGINFALKTEFYLKHKFLFDNQGREEDWRFLTKVFAKTQKIKVTDNIYYIAPIIQHLKKQ